MLSETKWEKSIQKNRPAGRWIQPGGDAFQPPMAFMVRASRALPAGREVKW